MKKHKEGWKLLLKTQKDETKWVMYRPGLSVRADSENGRRSVEWAGLVMCLCYCVNHRRQTQGNCVLGMCFLKKKLGNNDVKQMRSDWGNLYSYVNHRSGSN